MTDLEDKGVELAKKVISLSHSCEMDKLNELELARLKEVVDHARTIFVSAAEYDANDDVDNFGC